MPNYIFKLVTDLLPKEFGAGSGMGLAVVYGIIKKCKGAINIESTVGEGTFVEVLFPRIEVEVPAEEKKESELPKGNERILLVDDEKKAKKIGIEGFVMKPLDTEKLARAIRSILDKHHEV